MQTLSPTVKLPESLPTVKDAVAFIRRCDKGEMVKWTNEDLSRSIVEALRNNSFGYSTDDKTGKLNGLVIADVDYEQKKVHINIIALSGKRLLREYVKRFRSIFPDFKLVGERNGRLKRFFKLEIHNG